MFKRLMISVIAVCLLGTLACSKELHKYEYVPSESFPKMVYIEDQVQALNTQVELPMDKQMFVQVTNKDGESKYGKLIRITETDLVVSQGFHYSSKNDSTFKKESRVVIPKGDILILKVW